jgi:hypothetical protein
MGRWCFSDIAEMRLLWAQVDWHMSPVLLSMHELHIYETQVSTAPVPHDYQRTLTRTSGLILAGAHGSRNQLQLQEKLWSVLLIHS